MILIISNYDYYDISIGIIIILIMINIILTDIMKFRSKNSILKKIYVYLFGRKMKLPKKIRYIDYVACPWILTLENDSYINRLETGGIRYKIPVYEYISYPDSFEIIEQ
jgi:hypothetical protein